jgi:clan AA aspartic protease (TIGR02281 family)
VIRALTNLVLALVATPFGAVALATVLGIGVIRQGAPLLVAASATGLVLLPPVGLAALSRNPPRAGAVAVILWSSAVYLALPLYFPGERLEATNAGLSMLGDLVRWTPPRALVERIEAAVPSPRARIAPPRAAEVTPPALPPSQATLPDQVALPYEGRRNTLLLPVTFEGPKNEAELSMLFDTGATLTTLTAERLGQLGVRIPSDAPVVTMHTAAGDREARLVLLDRAWIGGFSVDGVTVSVCDACADERAEGLLGLNVSGQFLVTLDTVRHELVLQPRAGVPDRTLDIQPWVDVTGEATHWPDGRVEVAVEVRNRSDRRVDEVVVGVQCERTFLAKVAAIAPGKRGSTLVTLPQGIQCDRYGLALESGHW